MEIVYTTLSIVEFKTDNIWQLSWQAKHYFPVVAEQEINVYTELDLTLSHKVSMWSCDISLCFDKRVRRRGVIVRGCTTTHLILCAGGMNAADMLVKLFIHHMP